MSVGKTIKQLSEWSIASKVVSRDFFWDGHDWRTSSIDMVVVDCAKSSTILYVWLALLEIALCNNVLFRSWEWPQLYVEGSIKDHFLLYEAQQILWFWNW